MYWFLYKFRIHCSYFWYTQLHSKLKFKLQNQNWNCSHLFVLSLVKEWIYEHVPPSSTVLANFRVSYHSFLVLFQSRLFPSLIYSCKDRWRLRLWWDGVPTIVRVRNNFCAWELRMIALAEDVNKPIQFRVFYIWLNLVWTHIS